MSKIITFSRIFPSYHPKAGQPTFFVEKIWESLYLSHFVETGYFDKMLSAGFNIGQHGIYEPKHHTIRSGHRWKAGDWFSPRVWSGKPYHSKQIIIGPDIQVKKTWRFEIKQTPGYGMRLWINGFIIDTVIQIKLTQNDGLSMDDFMRWFQFPKPFSGQIICWNENINYL
jgi:hypothetical protein